MFQAVVNKTIGVRLLFYIIRLWWKKEKLQVRTEIRLDNTIFELIC